VTLYAIGDIQGCAAAFDALLEKIEFAPERDHLWLVGDLVNRGPDSLGVLRRVMALEASVTAVLGNHDLHLLATAAGVRSPGAQDTFQDILAAPDRETLIAWLRQRPLIHHDPSARRLLVHAGIPPHWSAEEACAQADAVSLALRAVDWQRALAQMYGSEPRKWSDTLSEQDRHRYTINALTRMRYCERDGRLDFSETGPPGSQPAHLVPWFDVPARRARDVHIIFGHWAALGSVRRPDVTALDSGCVWGGALTALALAPAGEPVAVSCAASPAALTPRPAP
jgi:bis(5'-nucleosyl)-tetraphosphatase (symmetrical)